MHQVTEPTHVVAIFGGASAGSVAAELLAEHGVQVVVFEQNPRPYGKIEDGLPRWHAKLRKNRQDNERQQQDRQYPFGKQPCLRFAFAFKPAGKKRNEGRVKGALRKQPAEQVG